MDVLNPSALAGQLANVGFWVALLVTLVAGAI